MTQPTSYPANSRVQVIVASSALVFVVAILAVGAWLVTRPTAEAAPEALASAAELPFIPPGPQIRSEASLRQDGAIYGPVYWAGPNDSTKYEFTLSGGPAYVRYLPDGTEAGDPRDGFLSVATYPVMSGYDTLVAIADEPGVTSLVSQSRALIVLLDDNPNSVYFSFPGADFQVEVYSPIEGEALALVSGGSIRLLR